jgi:hypothetical protein
MKNVMLIRAHVIRYLSGSMRGYISMLPDSAETADKFRGKEGEIMVARMASHILAELGHETDTPVEAAASHVRRSVKKALAGA